MITNEPGVLADSQIYISEPSLLARRAMMFVPFSGVYHCVEPYQIDRAYLDYLLFFFIDSGQLDLVYRGKTTRLTAGCLHIIDCKSPHQYRAAGDVRFRWFHVRGGSSQPFYEHLTDRLGNGVDTGRHFAIANSFNLLFALLVHTPVNEFLVNMALTRLLSDLCQIGEDKAAGENDAVQQAMAYLNDHFPEDLHLDDLARRVNLSTCHLARLFRRQYNLPPHEYLLSLRISEAKKYLLTTDLSIESIACQCGFNSASHFIRAFRQRVAMTPAQFRRQKF